MPFNFTPFPLIKTDRLILREMDSNDDKEIFLIRSDDSMNEFIGREKAASIEDARKHIHKIKKLIADGESIMWAICLKDNPVLAGTICLWNISPDHTNAEIGYELLPAYQGKGMIGEAIQAVLNYGFNTMNLATIIGLPVPANAKSIKVLEKSGFSFLKDPDQNLFHGYIDSATAFYLIEKETYQNSH